mmetsp:Transcript_125410/g.360318  ORF Transcript_125410/g.360318 Transcript_125410/m.360318 type:complete len:229 (+) Transcript_125410:257-943(+)
MGACAPRGKSLCCWTAMSPSGSRTRSYDTSPRSTLLNSTCPMLRAWHGVPHGWTGCWRRISTWVATTTSSTSWRARHSSAAITPVPPLHMRAMFRGLRWSRTAWQSPRVPLSPARSLPLQTSRSASSSAAGVVHWRGGPMTLPAARPRRDQRFRSIRGSASFTQGSRPGRPSYVALVITSGSTSACQRYSRRRGLTSAPPRVCSAKVRFALRHGSTRRPSRPLGGAPP